MKKIKKFAWAEYLLIAFYFGLFAIPFVIRNGYNLDYTIPLLLKTFPTNYFLYFTPIALYYFFQKKKAINQTESISINLIINTLLIHLLYLELFATASKYYIYTTIAILVLSVVFINTNDFVASFTLLPGLFVKQLGLAYIFTAYIPVLFLMMIKTRASQSESDEKSEKNLSFALLFAYLYTSVLTAILLLKHKIPLSVESIKPLLERSDDYINLISGIILIFAAFILFIIRAMPVIRKNAVTEKIAVIFAAVYPLCFAVMSSFCSLISYNFKTGFTLALLMYVINNIQLGITYKDTVGGIIPEKFARTEFFITAVILFGSFLFNRA